MTNASSVRIASFSFDDREEWCYIFNIMLKIRFQRVGRTNDPAFRLVVTDMRARPKTSGIEQLGSYHPKTKHTVLKNERILHWISQGAAVSPSAHNLLVRRSVIKGKKIAVKIAKVEKTENKK